MLDNNLVSIVTTRKHVVNLQPPMHRQRCGVNGTLAGRPASSSGRRHISSYYRMLQKQCSHRCSSPLTSQRKEEERKKHTGCLPPVGRGPLLLCTLCRCHENLFSRDCRSAATQHNRFPECGQHSSGVLQPADVFLLFP